MVRYCSNNMSCTPPEIYRDRFVNYMQKVIVKSSSFKSEKNPLMEKFKNGNFDNSNNILIQNNTSNYYNIINNNNNIIMNTFEDKNNNPINQNNNNNNYLNTNSLSIKKDTMFFNMKYATKEVIKEESEPGGVSPISSKRFSPINKNENSSFGVNVNEDNE